MALSSRSRADHRGMPVSLLTVINDAAMETEQAAGPVRSRQAELPRHAEAVAQPAKPAAEAVVVERHHRGETHRERRPRCRAAPPPPAASVASAANTGAASPPRAR